MVQRHLVFNDGPQDVERVVRSFRATWRAVEAMSPDNPDSAARPTRYCTFDKWSVPKQAVTYPFLPTMMPQHMLMIGQNDMPQLPTVQKRAHCLSHCCAVFEAKRCQVLGEYLCNYGRVVWQCFRFRMETRKAMAANICVEVLPNISLASHTLVCLGLPMGQKLGQFPHQQRGIVLATMTRVAVYAGDTVGDALDHVPIAITNQRALSRRCCEKRAEDGGLVRNLDRRVSIESCLHLWPAAPS